MAKHYKKGIVYPETAREWLRRYEGGEALKTIAQRDHFDIRTVKRQVAEAISDRNIKEVRQTVLRSALEQHFNDFVTLAEKMRGMVTAGDPISLDPDSILMLDGLRQHLPRSPLWDCLAKYEDKLVIVECKNEEQGEVENFQQSWAGVQEKWLEGFKNAMTDDKTPNISDSQVQEKSQGRANSDADNHVALNPSSDVKKENPRCILIEAKTTMPEDAPPPFVMDEVRKDVQLFNPSKDDIEMKRLQQHLNDELTTIVLRRVVPGRCRYCPI